LSDKFYKTDPVQGIAKITYDMWKLGWDEYNGGNVSYLLSDKEVEFLNTSSSSGSSVEVINMPENLIGRYLLITASGSHFRTLKENLRTDIGIVKITETGYTIVWGFEDGHRPTSEFYLHVLSHSARIDIDPDHKVVIHNHATNVVRLSLVLEPNDKDYTLPLWRVLTEAVYVFPDGIGVIPWEVPGTESIGKATAKKLQQSRIVVWANHGVMGTGNSFQDCFGLIETVNKSAGIYLDTLSLQKYSGLTNEEILAFADSLDIVPRQDILED